MKKIGTTTSGTVIVEMTTTQFDALAQIQAPPVANNPVHHTEGPKRTFAETDAYVRERIVKLKPKKKDGVVHSIKAMFQFTGGISEQEIEKVLQNLQKTKFVTIDDFGRVTYKDD
jgi:hypothetical protein